MASTLSNVALELCRTARNYQAPHALLIGTEILRVQPLAEWNGEIGDVTLPEGARVQICADAIAQWAERTFVVRVDDGRIDVFALPNEALQRPPASS